MVAKKVFTLVMILILCALSTFSQTESINLEFNKKIEKYLECKNGSLNQYGWIGLKEYLRSNGIDVYKFSKDIFSKEELIEYWVDALYLMTADKLDENPELVVNELISQYNRNISSITPAFQNYKITCINILKSLICPKCLKNDNIKGTLLKFGDDLIGNGEVMKNEYWFNVFKLKHLSTIQRKDLSPIQSKSVDYVKRAGYECAKLTGRMYLATNNPKYKDLLLELRSSNNSLLINAANYFLSEEFKNEWNKGNLDIFVNEKMSNRYANKDIADVETMKDLNEDARNKAKELKQNN